MKRSLLRKRVKKIKPNISKSSESLTSEAYGKQRMDDEGGAVGKVLPQTAVPKPEFDKKLETSIP
jgi:hypothetical protein